MDGESNRAAQAPTSSGRGSDRAAEALTSPTPGGKPLAAAPGNDRDNGVDPRPEGSADTTRTSPRESYDFEIDLDSDSTHARVVRLAGSNRRVLELGPATGYMSRVLASRGCSVVGIELDPAMAAQAAQYCERMIVGDLDLLDLDAELGSDRFDVIVAADVLEHLREPLAAVRRLREFLAPGGFFVISLPNVAHGSVRLALLEGHFQYRKLGLLDESHLRFFTRESVDELLDEAELAAAEIHNQELSIGASEVTFERSGVTEEVIRELERDPDARTYQFVIKAIPLEVQGLREMQRRMRELAHENARLRTIEPEVLALQDALSAIGGREGQLRSALIDAHEQLLQRDEEINRLREELLPLSHALARLRATPAGQLYVKLRRVGSRIAGRAARYRSALRGL